MEEWTPRQRDLYLKWRDEHWHEPSVSDFYSMQIAAEIRRVLHSKPNKVRMEHFLLKPQKVGQHRLTREQTTQMAKAKWLGMMTKPVVKREAHGSE